MHVLWAWFVDWMILECAARVAIAIAESVLIGQDRVGGRAARAAVNLWEVRPQCRSGEQSTPLHDSFEDFVPEISEEHPLGACLEVKLTKKKKNHPKRATMLKRVGEQERLSFVGAWAFDFERLPQKHFNVFVIKLRDASMTYS